MKIIRSMRVLVLALVLSAPLQAQETDTQKTQNPPQKEEIAMLLREKERVLHEEKANLRKEVERINSLVAQGSITAEEGEKQKKEAAERSASIIASKHAVIDNQIALAQQGAFDSGEQKRWGAQGRSFEKEDFESWYSRRYSKATYGQIVLGVGFNNTLQDDVSLDDSPYELGGSRYFEIGWQWKTRLLKESNALRLVYGFSFQFNGFKLKDNQYLVKDGNLTTLEPFPQNLDKSKFRMDNLVVPVYLEISSGGRRDFSENRTYTPHGRFRLGLGGFAGVNLSTRQKLKYHSDGERVKEKIKDDYNTNDLVYGLAAYAGFGDTSLYFSYDLNEIFSSANPAQNRISLGLRWEL